VSSVISLQYDERSASVLLGGGGPAGRTTVASDVCAAHRRANERSSLVSEGVSDAAIADRLFVSALVDGY